jgi:NADH-quinone oxidoreductase subunit L
VIHAVGTNDMFRMGGLARAMPHTAITFIVGTVALAGVWPLSGFFSKEAILGGVWESGMTASFVMLALTAFLTAFYMFRAVILAFFGRAHAGGHPHEAPWLMRGPLWILALATVGLGLTFAIRGVPGAEGHHPPGWLVPFSIGLALAGIALAWATYQRGAVSAAALSRAFGPIDFMARRRYGIDALYGGLYQAFILGFSRLVGWVDRYLVDGLLNVFSAWSLRGGDLTRRIQTGQAQDYLYGVAFGVLLVVVFARWWSR